MTADALTIRPGTLTRRAISVDYKVNNIEYILIIYVLHYLGYMHTSPCSDLCSYYTINIITYNQCIIPVEILWGCVIAMRVVMKLFKTL